LFRFYCNISCIALNCKYHQVSKSRKTEVGRQKSEDGSRIPIAIGTEVGSRLPAVYLRAVGREVGRRKYPELKFRF